MQARGDNRSRAAILVVSGVDDKLVIERQLKERHRQLVIGLEDLLESGMGQHAVADQNAKAAVVEISLVHTRNAVDYTGQPNRIVGPSPQLSVQREPCGNCAIDVGKLIRLDIAVGETGAHERADLVGDLLLDIDADSAPTGVLAHRRGARNRSRRRGQSDRVGITSHAAPAEKSSDSDFARLAPHLVTPLDFANPLKLIEGWIEFRTVGDDREIKYPAAHRPVTLVPFDSRPIGEAPGVGGIIECTGIDECPVHEVVAWIVSIFVVVEYVGHAEFADRNHHAVFGLRAAELVEIAVDLFAVAAKVDRLPDERARHARIGHRGTDFVGLTAGESGNSERAAQAKPLIELRIDPELGALPQPHAEIRSGVPGLAPLIGIEAIGAEVRTAEWQYVLLEERGLTVDRKIVGLERRRIGCVAGLLCAIAIEPVVQPEAQFVEVEIGIEAL